MSILLNIAILSRIVSGTWSYAVNIVFLIYKKTQHEKYVYLEKDIK